MKRQKRASDRTPPLATIPAGYAILPFGAGFQPVLVVRPGVYRELGDPDGRFEVGAVCATQDEALSIIAKHPRWKAQRDEIERGQQRQAQRAQAKKGGKR